MSAVKVLVAFVIWAEYNLHFGNRRMKEKEFHSRRCNIRMVRKLGYSRAKKIATALLRRKANSHGSPAGRHVVYDEENECLRIEYGYFNGREIV